MKWNRLINRTGILFLAAILVCSFSLGKKTSAVKKKTAKKGSAEQSAGDVKSLDESTTLSKATTQTIAEKQKKLPRLVDLGADKCIPCKMMAPVLEELKKEYKGQMEVEFIDVWKNPQKGQDYRIRSIPTQIFYDAEGKELFRHEGYFPKEDIIKIIIDKKMLKK